MSGLSLAVTALREHPIGLASILYIRYSNDHHLYSLKAYKVSLNLQDFNMKFLSSAILAFGISTIVSAAPADKRQDGATTVFGTITDTLTTLRGSLTDNEAAIASAASSVQSAVGASVSIAAAVNANIQQIVTALQTASSTITTVTGGSIGSIIVGGTQLTQAQVNLLVFDIKQVQAIIVGIGATLQITATNLGPNITTAISSETQALQSAIAPFTTPLTVFAKAVAGAGARANLTVTGIAGALNGLQTIFNGFWVSLGLPALNLPGLGN